MAHYARSFAVNGDLQYFRLHAIHNRISMDAFKNIYAFMIYTPCISILLFNLKHCRVPSKTFQILKC